MRPGVAVNERVVRSENRVRCKHPTSNRNRRAPSRRCGEKPFVRPCFTFPFFLAPGSLGSFSHPLTSYTRMILVDPTLPLFHTVIQTLLTIKPVGLRSG